MPPRLVAAGAPLLMVLAACGAGQPATGTAPTAPASSAGVSPAAIGPTAPTAAVDLSQVDACAIVPVATVEAVTGETGFTADGSSSASGADCFWAVPRPGVPQYLEVGIARRTASLEGYGISPNGVACPGTTVPGLGIEAVGAVCSGEQTKVWLAAMDRGVLVQVLVNEPKGALAPADLADAVNRIIASLE